MRKWVILGVFVLAVVAALAFALVNLDGYLDRNQAWIAEQVQTALGRQVAFDAVRVSLTGGLGVRITNLRIADDASFSEDDFVRAEAVKVLVRILPALRGRYEVRRVVLDAPELTVIRSPAGFNFDSLGGSKTAAPDADAPAAIDTGAAQQDHGVLASLLVGAVNVSDGLVRYIDRTATPPAETVMRRLDVKATEFSPTSALQVEMSAAIFGAEKGNFQLSGSVGPLPSRAGMEATPLDLKLAVGPLVIDELQKIEAIAGLLPPELRSHDPIRIEASASGTVGDLVIEASLSLTDVDLVYADSFHKARGVPLKIDLRGNRTADSLRFEQLDVSLSKLELRGKGQVLLSDAPTLDLQLELAPSSLEGLGELSPQMAEVDVVGQVSGRLSVRGDLDGSVQRLNGSFAFQRVRARHEKSPVDVDDLSGTLTVEDDAIRFSPVTLTLGGSQIEANLTVQNFRQPMLTLAAHAAEILPSRLGAGTPDDVLRELQIDATLRTSTAEPPKATATLQSAGGRLRGMDFQRLEARVTREGERTTVEKFRFEAFEGTLNASAWAETKDPQSPQFETTLQIREMALAPMVKSQLGDTAANIEGRLQADLTLGGSGKEWEVIRDRLVGRGRLEVDDGVLKDVNIAESVLGSVSGVRGLGGLVSPQTRDKYPGLFSTGDTHFEELSGTIRIADGQGTTDDLTLAAPDYAIRAAGTIGLDSELDLEATLDTSKRLTADLIANAKEARYLTNQDGRLEIPFRLRGSPPKVKAQPDAEFIAKALTRALAGTLAEHLLGGKKDSPAKTPGAPVSPQKQLLKGLEGLFNR